MLYFNSTVCLFVFLPLKKFCSINFVINCNKIYVHKLPLTVGWAMVKGIKAVKILHQESRDISVSMLGDTGKPKNGRVPAMCHFVVS